MTTPGHGLVGYLLSRPFRRWNWPASGFIVGSLLPDIDLLLLPFPFFESVHGTVTHSLVFITVMALVLHRPFGFGGMFLGGLSALVLDTLMDNNPANGLGVWWFWPFYSEKVHFGWTLHFAWHDVPPWSDPVALLKQTALEIPVVLAAGVAAWRDPALRGWWEARKPR